MSKCYVEARILRSSDTWKPIPGLFGVGRYEFDDEKSAGAEIDRWQKSTYGKHYEFRVRAAVKPPEPKTEAKRVAEVAKIEATSKSIAKSLTAARKAVAK